MYPNVLTENDSYLDYPRVNFSRSDTYFMWQEICIATPSPHSLHQWFILLLLM